MNNFFSFNKIDKLEMEANIISEVTSELYHLLFYKIRKNSKAYSEIETLISDFNKKEKAIKNKITLINNSTKTNFSEIKIDTILLEKLILLRNNLKIQEINSLIEFLFSYYEEDLYTNKLTIINDFIISKTVNENLKYSQFNIGVSDNEEQKIVYIIDDLIVKDGLHYLNLTNFKSYKHENSNYYLFSPSFTLADLDEFFSIIKM